MRHDVSQSRLFNLWCFRVNQRFRAVGLVWRSVAQAFARPAVKPIMRLLHFLLADASRQLALREALAQEPFGFLADPALPEVVRWAKQGSTLIFSATRACEANSLLWSSVTKPGGWPFRALSFSAATHSAVLRRASPPRSSFLRSMSVDRHAPPALPATASSPPVAYHCGRSSERPPTSPCRRGASALCPHARVAQGVRGGPWSLFRMMF